jgi:hypothetical protein
VDVGLDVVGHLEVDDERHVGDVDTTSGEIGRDEDVAFAAADRVQRRFSLFLILARMKSRCVPLPKKGNISLERDGETQDDERELVGDPSSGRRHPSSG